MTDLENSKSYYEDRISLIGDVIELCELCKNNHITIDNLIGELIDLQMELSERIYFKFE